MDNNSPFDSEVLFEDVQTTVQEVHLLGQVHNAIAEDLGTYFSRGSINYIHVLYNFIASS